MHTFMRRLCFCVRRGVHEICVMFCGVFEGALEYVILTMSVRVLSILMTSARSSHEVLKIEIDFGECVRALTLAREHERRMRPAGGALPLGAC